MAGDKCGWLCRTLKKVKSVADDLGIQIPFIGLAIKAVGIVENELFGRGLPFSINSEPTPAEEIILNKWFDNKLNPFFLNMYVALQNALQTNSIATVNLYLAKMCIIQEYYITNETSGLSANAIKARQDLINELFTPLRAIVQKQLGNATIANVTANQNDFKGLFSLSVQGEVYSCGQYAVSQTQQPLVVAPIRTITPGTLPTSTPIAPATQFTTLVPTSPGTKDPTNQNVIVPVDPQEDTVTISKKGGWNWLATLSAASVLLTAYSIFKKDKPKN